MISLGSKYTLKVFVSSGPQSKERLDWTLGHLVMPKSVDYKLPEIEDHFYKMPEIYTPEEEQKSEGKKNSIYQLIGIIGAIALPWICFIIMVKPNLYIHRLKICSGRIPDLISQFRLSFLTIPNRVRSPSLLDL